MKALISAIIVVGAIFTNLVGLAQTSEPMTTRPSGYDRLSSLIGRWTIKGSEEMYVEVCRWYEGNFHIICETENKRADGTVSHSMSILGYLPDKDTYTYHGIGSKGRNETMSGAFADGVFEFTVEAVDNGATVISRVRMGPFSEREVPFVAESSTDRVSWAVDATLTYVRLE
jgi:hypothetical protein